MSKVDYKKKTFVRSQKVIICPHCETENPADAKYCKECGRKLRESSKK